MRGGEFAQRFDGGMRERVLAFGPRQLERWSCHLLMWKTAGKQVWEEDQQFALGPGEV